MSKKNLIAGQSGGPTAAINSSLYGVVSEALKHTEEIDHVYGMVNGIEGFLNGTVLDFQEALPGEQLRALTWTPGAYLGSCRYKLPESLEDPVYPKLFRKFEEMNIGWSAVSPTSSCKTSAATSVSSASRRPLIMTL